MRHSTIFSLYEKAIVDFEHRLAYLKWKIPNALATRSSEIYDVSKKMEENVFLLTTSSLFRELVATSYLIAIEDELLLATPQEFAEDITIYIQLTKKDIWILGNNPTQCVIELIIPFFEAFLLTYQMTGKLVRFIVTRTKSSDNHELIKAQTLNTFLIPTLQQIQELFHTPDLRWATTLMYVAMTGFLSQHAYIMKKETLMAFSISKTYRTAIEEYPPLEGNDILFDISWRLVLIKIWPSFVSHLA